MSYRAGYINVTNGSAAVVGVGTRFSEYARAGDTLAVVQGASTITATVESVNGLAGLTLTAAWSGATAEKTKYNLTHVDVMTKQQAFDRRFIELQDEIRLLSRQPIQSVDDDGTTVVSYYATDNFRDKLKYPESIGVDGMGGVRFWGSDGIEHTVGIGWFDLYSPLINILKRDKLLDAQLYDARAELLALLADSGVGADDILEYSPGFTIPGYPYS